MDLERLAASSAIFPTIATSSTRDPAASGGRSAASPGSLTRMNATSGVPGAAASAASVRPPVVSTSAPERVRATSIAAATLACHAAVENGRTTPVVPRWRCRP